MNSAKIVALPSAKQQLSLRPTDPSEARLFSHDVGGEGKYAIVNVNEFEEEAFLTLLVRNSVRSVLDLRARPVFSRPRYNHKRVISYLFQRRIKYLEYRLIVSDFELRSSAQAENTRLRTLLSAGLMICLIDERERTIACLQEMKKLLQRERAAEVHPRSM